MTEAAFTTELLESGNLLTGPWRSPKQMLHAQVYDSHASIHDDATAQKLGFQGGTIEGPTHFSQFAPLCERIWGQAWFETGCLSAHYRNPAFEGEEVQANIEKPKPGQTTCAIGMTRRDGTEILRGTASVWRCDGNGIKPAAWRTEAARRSRHSRRPQGRHEDASPDGQNGFRPAHGRPLSVFARAEAEGHHRTLGVLFAGAEPLGPGDHSHGDAERAVSVPRPRGQAADPWTGGRAVRRSGNPPAARAVIRRRELHDRARGGRAQRQPPHRERVGAHDGVRRRRQPGRDHAARTWPASKTPTPTTSRSTKRSMAR